ncbi:MAG: carbohydrate ABC transporter permease [Fimbriimonadaceae bacterium]|nr:carbohydrate ABC transporter permease [Fimbriimonadaceae bacterium]QYK54941.1 MAG: carbohydrate ABC transporter permease [Fimbriimonadaceae bacterium]
MSIRKLPAVVVLLLGSIVFAAPFWTALCIALKTPSEIATTSAWAFPVAPTFDNFREVLTNPNVSFFRFFINSAIISTLTTLGVTLSAAAVAYPFARLTFPARNRLFALMLATMMLPGVVTMIPTYVLYKYLHWIDTFLPLVVPAFLGGGAFNIFLLRQFFLGIPKELDEAAILDGASHFTIFSRILLPLAKPALATVAILTFIGSWRDFLGPLLYLNDVDKQTLELGLQTYNSLVNVQWHLLMAGSVLVTIPLIVLFFVGQRFFVKGITMTGIK